MQQPGQASRQLPPIMGIHRQAAAAHRQLPQGPITATQTGPLLPKAFGHRQTKTLLQGGIHREITPVIQLPKASVIHLRFPAQRQAQLKGPLHQGHHPGVVGPTHQHQFRRESPLGHQKDHCF